jgi:integrase
VKLLVEAAEGEWKLLIPLAYYTAARLGDCCRMQWDGVDLAKAELTYTQSKTGKKVIVPLHPDLLARLNERAGTDKPEVFILPQLASQRVSGRRGLSESFKKIMRKAGLDLQTVKGTGKRMFSKRTFHSLRHTANSEMANKGVSVEVRMGVTGHKSTREHQKYTHLEMDTRRAAVDTIPSLNQ